MVINTDTYCGERAEAVVLIAYLAKFGEWPLTARELKTEHLAGQLPPIGPLADMV